MFRLLFCHNLIYMPMFPAGRLLHFEQLENHHLRMDSLWVDLTSVSSCSREDFNWRFEFALADTRFRPLAFLSWSLGQMNNDMYLKYSSMVSPALRKCLNTTTSDFSELEFFKLDAYGGRLRWTSQFSNTVRRRKQLTWKKTSFWF